jgi:hypothetical protein
MADDWRIELTDLDADAASVVLLMRIEEHLRNIWRVVLWFTVISVLAAVLGSWALLVAASSSTP